MTQLFFADLVREKTSASGMGPLALEGALPGHRRFGDAVPAATRFHYSVAGVSRPQEWEVGEGELDAAGRLVRSPHASSAGGALVDFGAGLKTVALTVAASWFSWLDAWGDVGWQRYRFKQAGTGKGQKGRWHVGLVAQAVHAAFAGHGLDAFELGLLCRDAWDEERAAVVSRRTGQGMPKRTRQVLAAGDRWGLRYDECLAMEAAWVRRELGRLGLTAGRPSTGSGLTVL